MAARDACTVRQGNEACDSSVYAHLASTEGWANRWREVSHAAIRSDFVAASPVLPTAPRESLLDPRSARITPLNTAFIDAWTMLASMPTPNNAGPPSTRTSR